MQRLISVDPQVAVGRTKEQLDTVQQAFGMFPNAARVMANSTAVLDSFLAFSTAMGGARIGEKLLNQLKLTTSETNSCSYCTSILSAVAPSAALTADDILAGRIGNSQDRRTKAALALANDVLESRGKVTNQHNSPPCGKLVLAMPKLSRSSPVWCWAVSPTFSITWPIRISIFHRPNRSKPARLRRAAQKFAPLINRTDIDRMPDPFQTSGSLQSQLITREQS